ncbi:hypothetical protein [Streptomyces sp. NPDC050738]|uniref:hypothetical protein n=1 Tax=Streptomyces sp. NPDC050738 TaxID=3154744 RepID=UPI0034266356
MDVYMQGKDALEGSPANRLYLWIESLHEIMARFLDQFMHGDWEHLYSARELPDLEEQLLSFCKSDDGSDTNALFVESAAAYLGETLVEEAGGRWEWDARAGVGGLPVICPDPVLGLDPIVPHLVVGQAVTDGSGRTFATLARLLRTAVRDRQEEHREWWPKRVPTPWISYGCLMSALHEADRWRNNRMLDYLDWWAAEAGGRERWNFTTTSLDTLQALLRKTFPTVEDYYEACDEPFWVMAAWYVGECIVQNKDAQWQFRGINPDAPLGTWHAEDSYWTNAVFVNQRLRYDGHAELLPVMLHDVVAGQSLREVVDRFPDPLPSAEYIWGEPAWPTALWPLARPEHLQTPAVPSLTGEELKRLEKADDLQGPDWADNHRLNSWLDQRREAFPAWAEEAGGGTIVWDFSPESLDRLEGLVRTRFATYEEMVAAGSAPFLVGAAWYFGEVQVKRCGAAWRWCPKPGDEPTAHDSPMVARARPDAEDEDQGDEDVYGDDGDAYDHVCEPAGCLRALLLRESEANLRDALELYG